MNQEKSNRFKPLNIYLTITVSIITILGFFGIKQYTDLFDLQESDKGQLLEEYFHGSKWEGSWTDLDQHGLTYSAVLKLSVSNNSNIDGSIIWKLSKSPYIEDQGKIGLVATEIVTGTYNDDNSKVTLTGINKVDPYGIIQLAKYNLELSKNKRHLTGFDNLTTGNVEFNRFE